MPTTYTLTLTWDPASTDGVKGRFGNGTWSWTNNNNNFSQADTQAITLSVGDQFILVINPPAGTNFPPPPNGSSHHLSVIFSRKRIANNDVLNTPFQKGDRTRNAQIDMDFGAVPNVSTAALTVQKSGSQTGANISSYEIAVSLRVWLGDGKKHDFSHDPEMDVNPDNSIIVNHPHH